MSSSDLPSYVEKIIPDLLSGLIQAKESLSQLAPANNTNNNGNNGSSSSSHSFEDEKQNMGNQLDKFRADLNYIKSSFHKLKNFEDSTSVLIKALQDISFSFDNSTTQGHPNHALRVKQQFQAKLRVMNEIILKLKLQIPSPHKLSTTESDANRYARNGNVFNVLQMDDKLPDLHVHNLFQGSLAFCDFRVVYESLEHKTKMCCLCFAVFPENEVVKKRLLLYWWIGEEFVTPPIGGEQTAEKIADEILKELVMKGCIEPVKKKKRLIADSYKMNPFIRSAVIVIAKEIGFFDFDQGNPNFLGFQRVCLMKDPSQQTLRKDPEKDPENLQTIFNVNEPYPDFFKLEWFSKLKNVKVLYLGRWQSSAKLHIEVESIEFLKGLRNMKLLRFFSLQGISRIMKLPDSVCKLPNLRILDLRACHNLEVLPNRIGSLKKLTRLDLSECYLLEYIPKGIALLSELQVLKGFVIGDRLSRSSCTLDELLGLKKLRKLSIYTNRKAFPTDEEVTTLQRIEKLQKLTIMWGGSAFLANAENPAKQDKGTSQTMAATTMSPKKSGDGKKQEKGVAQQMAATTVSPKKSGDNKMQDLCVGQPMGATTPSPKSSGNNKSQDKDAAQPMAATSMSPKNIKDIKKKNKDKAAAQPLAANTTNPEINADNRKHDKGAAEPEKSSGIKQRLAKTMSKLPTFKEQRLVQGDFKELEKLDLQCYPQMTAPSWLMPGKLEKLKKLYIRGGELQTLGHVEENDKWKVEILRLKFLSDLKMDWRELRTSFPHLIYLEKFKCPKFTCFPCDEDGVWLKA